MESKKTISKEASLKNRIIDDIQKYVKVSDKVALELYDGFIIARDSQQSYQGYYYRQIKDEQYFDSLTSLNDNIRKFNNTLKNIPQSERDGLDAYYLEANKTDPAILELMNISSVAPANVLDDILSKSLRIEEAIKLAEQKFVSVGTGGSSNNSRKHLAGIKELAQYFGNALPKNKISCSKGTKFNRYVQLWFYYFIDKQARDMRDVRTPIKTYLNFEKSKITM